MESWADVSSGGSGVFASQEMANVRKQAEHPHAVLESPLSQEVLGFRFHLSNYQNFSSKEHLKRRAAGQPPFAAAAAGLAALAFDVCGAEPYTGFLRQPLLLSATPGHCPQQRRPPPQ